MWIETPVVYLICNVVIVTPHTGVWIETICARLRGISPKVTPHTGVWIETYKLFRG